MRAETFDVFNIEGRYGASLEVEHTSREHLTFGPVWTRGIGIRWVQPDDFRTRYRDIVLENAARIFA